MNSKTKLLTKQVLWRYNAKRMSENEAPTQRLSRQVLSLIETLAVDYELKPKTDNKRKNT